MNETMAVRDFTEPVRDFIEECTGLADEDLAPVLTEDVASQLRYVVRSHILGEFQEFIDAFADAAAEDLYLELSAAGLDDLLLTHTQCRDDHDVYCESCSYESDRVALWPCLPLREAAGRHGVQAVSREYLIAEARAYASRYLVNPYEEWNR